MRIVIPGFEKLLNLICLIGLINLLTACEVRDFIHLEGEGAYDTQAPSTPEGLSSTVLSAYHVYLTWQASSDDVGVTRYRILRDGKSVGFTNTTSFLDMSARPNSSYSYSIVALDTARNTSIASLSVKCSTLNSVQ